MILFIKYFNPIFSIFLLFLSNSLFSNDNPSVAIATFVSGDVSYLRNGNVSVPKKNDYFQSTDEIQVGNKGMIDIQMGSGTIVRLKSNSKLKINSILESESKESINLDLLKGTIFSKAKKKDGKELNFSVKAPSFTAGVRGTEFAISAGETEDQDLPEGVFVKEGNVAVQDKSSSNLFSINGGEELVKNARGLQKQILDDAIKEKLRILETLNVMKESSYQMLKDAKLKNKEMLENTKNQSK